MSPRKLDRKYERNGTRACHAKFSLPPYEPCPVPSNNIQSPQGPEPVTPLGNPSLNEGLRNVELIIGTPSATIRPLLDLTEGTPVDSQRTNTAAGAGDGG